MARKKFQRQCNICSNNHNVSDDHVPPKCCANTGAIKTELLFESEIDKNLFRINLKGKHYQNGIYFSSICSNCNSKLGNQFDSELGKFRDEVIRKIGKCDYNMFKVKLNRITRAISGHMLASFNEYNEDGFVEKELRNYFRNTSLSKPNKLYMYFWYYPFDKYVIARNIGIYGNSVLDGAIVSIMKFHPFSFMLTDKKIDRFIDLFDLTTNELDEFIQLRVDVNDNRDDRGMELHEDWPLYKQDDYVFIITENVLQNTKFAQVSK